MTQSPDSKSTSNLPAETALPITIRADLQISKSSSVTWTIKDPLSGQFTRLREHDYFVFQLLREWASIEQIQQQFFQTYAPHRISQASVLNFVQRLWNLGLLQIERQGISSEFIRRSTQDKQTELRQRITNPLAIRFRGFDPDRLLAHMLPAVAWIFHPLTFVLSCLLLWIASLVAADNINQILLELPEVQSLLTSNQLVWLFVTIAVTKVVHELGHGFACKHFGGECHEMGVMLLAFTPCLYCNVSDAWKIPNRWQRIAISGAGIYVELLLAAICLLLWSCTVPGVLHTLCLYVAVIGAISTLFLNGNPLLRYDGYYILSDLVGIPNLRSQSVLVLREWVARLFFGVRIPNPFQYSLRTRTLLALYGILSTIYLWFVLFAILWMLYQFLTPWGLNAIAVLFGVLIVGSRVISSLATFKRFAHRILTRKQSSRFRFVVGMTVIAGILVYLILIPLPRKLHAPCLIVSSRETPVHVTIPGQLVDVQFKDGDTVDAGNRIASLMHHDVELRELKLQGQIDRQLRQIELLEQRQTFDSDASARLPTARSELEDFRQQLAKVEESLTQLDRFSPHAGMLIAADVSDKFTASESEFSPEGSPLQNHNQGMWLESGTVLCRIVDPDSREAILYVDQAEVALIKVGDSVVITADQLSGQTLNGTISDISSSPIPKIPDSLAAQQILKSMRSPEGFLIPATPTYEVRVQLPKESGLVLGQSGQGVITLATETLLTKLNRYFAQTFTFGF